MTCDLCDMLYKVLPCKTDKELTMDGLKIHGDKVSTFNIMYYNDLRNHCPCRDCLVRTMCTMGQTNKCPQYIDFENFTITKADRKDNAKNASNR